MRLETPERPLETPERALTRLPQQPGPNAHPVYCDGREGRCRNKLGVSDGAHAYVRHGGRGVVAALPVELVCERCGQHTMLLGRAA